jgi:ABC transport system ATP-binding/permease protein
MEVFRRVADAGTTVVCITHNLANVEANCHLVVILTEGGRLAFVGTPTEALRYFKINRLGDVYKAMSARKPDEWKAAFIGSPLYERYVRSRLPAHDPRAGTGNANSVPTLARVSLVKQAGVLIRRYLSVWRGDMSALLAMLGQSLLVGILIAIVFGDLGSVDDVRDRVFKTRNLLFLLNISCFWLGCNNAAKELVKERVIFTRERDFNLRADAYLISKLAVLVCIGLFQVNLLFAIVQVCCGPAGSPIGQWEVMFALAVAGTALGLFISSLAGSEEVAIALVPIAVIPQIILAGVIAVLSGLGKVLAMVLVTCHWGERALEALLSPDNIKPLGIPERQFLPQLLVVVGHAAIFISIAMVILSRRDRRG